MIPAVHAFPCGRIINIGIVSLLAITNAERELAWENVSPQGLVLEQIKPILAPRAHHDIFSLPIRRVLAGSASGDYSVTPYTTYQNAKFLLMHYY